MNYYCKTKIIIKVLGAGQTVGRSCVIVELENRKVMFDCGCHLGYKDERKYPNFNLLVSDNKYEKKVEEGNYYENLNSEVNISIVNSSILDKEKLISKLKKINEIIDCVIISHFHMDHIGALPFFTEILKYRGTIIMSYPTKALSPILLLDSCRVADMKWEKKNFERQIKMLNEKSDELLNYNINCLKKDPWNINEDNIYNCINKVVGLQINETYELGNMSITPYYAGHVLGACIFKIEVNNFSVIYTGDYNTVPDKHLGSAKIPSLSPEIFISESTYATYIRPTRKSSELELCNLVHECVNKGGKVLIPVFAIGRAQELSILLDDYWKKMKINYPIYFGCGLTENANKYYKIYSSWINSSCISTKKKNLFDFTNIFPFMNNYLNENRPMVLFATPGMLHTGLSLKAFKSWASNSKNLIILPGYCVQGTVGHKLIMGERKISVDANTVIKVSCKIIYLSFSAHADSNGIQQLIKHVSPQNVIFVHGEKNGMEKLSKHITNQHFINSMCPSLGQKCEFNFYKENVNFVYLHHNLYKKILQSLKINKEESSNLLKDMNILDKEDFKLSSYNDNITVPFNSYIFHCTIHQKPFLFFFSKKALISYLKKRFFPIFLCHKNQVINIKNLFNQNEKENFLKKLKQKKRKRKSTNMKDIKVCKVKKNNDKSTDVETHSLGNDKNNNSTSNINNTSINSQNFKSDMQLKNSISSHSENTFAPPTYSYKSEYEETLEKQKKLEKNDFELNNKNSIKEEIMKKNIKLASNYLNSSYKNPSSSNKEKNTSKMFPDNNASLNISSNSISLDGNKNNLSDCSNNDNESTRNKKISNNHKENKNKNDNDDSINSNNEEEDEHVRITDEYDNIFDKDDFNESKDNFNFVHNEDKITFPLLNLRFKENINIKYQSFYNFVITFFQESMNAKNKKKINFLGKRVIIKNTKHNDNFYFFLSFHSLRAIHDGNNSLLIQWSYIDDSPDSVTHKFINSIHKFIEDT
ncbi:cleavage and polyadenylation specificity factor, putative [Plasmodium gallinaceum]|uniref:Cleavage and polyadenylation specificity factor, putative n=1 Tax=Plasmodium gallinaceum TaxID=5849 RepID=A0A1J1GP58_PLAGA|nr:cleavage and polyadenylation specificity factor, putative [Plasmodium gallinaceum]CRG94273.1 cleavage and polyadenylation specificity factor, putative [Plasmodium gallinaceum]